MDVNKIIWCLQSGSEDVKTKLMSLLTNINLAIDAEMVIPLTKFIVNMTILKLYHLSNNHLNQPLPKQF